MIQYDCVIVGAGQSGLYAARLLKEREITYVVLERNEIGQVWHDRWEGMRLFTSRQFCGLPGLSFPGDPDGFPSAHEMGDYLKAFADELKLCIREKSSVISLSKENGLFLLTLENGECISAKSVINATGSNQVPVIPSMSSKLSSDIVQFDGTISSLSQIPEASRIVVVGDGATGRQIAGRLASTCKVTLSTGTSRGLPPGVLAGKDIFWWLNKAGILFADKQSFIAKFLKTRNPVPCGNFNNHNLVKMGVHIVGRAKDCFEKTVIFENGDHTDIDVIIWAVGYRDNTEWLKLFHCINNDGFIEDYGITPEPGLFVLGRKWLSCRASELLMGLPKDAELVISALEAYLNKSLNASEGVAMTNR